MRSTITTCTDDPTELTTVEAWFVTWASHITHRSDNQGCGCCVDIWTVDATDEAFAALPRHLWSETGPDGS
jgi:hypothetical protein